MGSLEAEVRAKDDAKVVSAEKKRIKQLEKLVEQQAEAIERMRRPHPQIPLGSKPSGKRASAFVRVIVPDSHGIHIDHTAANAFLADLKELQPREVVMLGDHLDCGGWLAQHHVLGFVPETAYTFEDDCHAANHFLDQIGKRVTGARSWYIEGNHEHRIVKAIIKMTLGCQRDAETQLKLWGCKAALSLEKRGIEFVRRDELQPGLKIRGAIKLGKCYFTHGKNCGSNATYRTLQQFKANVVHGHTHRMSHASVQSAEEQMLGGWSFGCLCKMQPLYYDTNPTDWSHGYGVQFVEPDGSFTTWAIPIIEGKSRLTLLLNRGRKG
jgi:UDP-2,3-diacylglucosamine pyrophosphatase LpxH